MIKRFIEEAEPYLDGAPISASNLVRLLCFNMGFQLNISYRIHRRLHRLFREKKLLWLIPSVFQYASRLMFGSYISPEAKIGKRLKIYYGTGIVIGSKVVAGNDLQILNNVTLGSTFPNLPEIKQPKIGNNVFIGTGAKVLGDVTIGDNVKIGANAVVLQSFGSNVTVAGVPAKIVNCKTARIGSL